MFHFASAIFWFLVQPINLAILLLAACLVLGALRWRRLSLSAGILSLIVLVLSAWTTLGALMLHPLEDRFARPVPAPEHVDGIIVLGGGFEGSVNLARGGYELNSSGDRFVEAAALAHRYPDAKILISGGHASMFLEGEGDADSGSRMLVALGVDRSRLVLEGKSRDTFENAVYSKELAKPEPGQTWLLVTSAFHMPRSVAVFRAAGFPVVPWPTDYRTAGDETFGLAEDDPIDCLEKTSVAEREWIALLAYWLLGRTDTLLPSR
jgi:uncharacterized SAM-binding protein YcdF (DUF218 family)